MTYRNERFNRSLHSLDLISEQHDLSKCSCVSDGGAGVEHLLDIIDWTPPSHIPRYQRELVRIMHGIWLELNHRGHLVPTFDLICRHGRFSDESIAELAHNSKSSNAARKKYYEHRKTLCFIYGVQ